MEYHVFKKPKRLKSGKTVHRWYYYYLDEHKKQVQKACKGCKTRKEAEDYIRSLPDISTPAGRIRVRDIASDMFLDGSAHMKRRANLGRRLSSNTQMQARGYIEHIIEKWGNMTLSEINPSDITKYLFTVERSGSWKNRYKETFGEIYAEAQWYGCRVERPRFQQFARNNRKADIFTTAELERLFVPANFPTYELYLFFLLCLSCGLRLGEVRAVRAKQFIFERKALLVDGFCKINGERTNYNKTGSAVNPRFRVVLLPNLTLLKMKDHIASNNIALDDFCFKMDGRPLRQSRAERVFTDALSSARIDMADRKLVVHSLRYTDGIYAAVTRMRRELSAETVRRMVGHSNLQMTDYYTDRKAIEETLCAIQDAYPAVDNLFS